MRYSLAKCINKDCPNNGAQQRIVTAIPIGSQLHQHVAGKITCDVCGHDVWVEEEK